LGLGDQFGIRDLGLVARNASLDFDQLVTHLRSALAQPLPGAAAQAALAPRPRRRWPSGFNPARARHAAGLLLVFPVARAPHVVLTVRGHALRHGGQVSLPGGVVEPGESFEQAALREAHEEVALDPAQVRVLGSLTPLDIPVSGFRLHPVVGAAHSRPALHPADGEVARILEVPISDLLDPARFVEKKRVRDGQAMAIPALQLDDVELWGATAMVMAEFLAVLGWQAPRPRR
jgi:8-oxo-dGTP pyrophosphatase MutT (NUDIX family)